jgi:hypothetical protein
MGRRRREQQQQQQQQHLQPVHELQTAHHSGAICVIQYRRAVQLALHEHLALLQSAVDAVAPHKAVQGAISPHLRARDVAAGVVRGLNAVSFAAGEESDMNAVLA